LVIAAIRSTLAHVQRGSGFVTFLALCAAAGAVYYAYHEHDGRRAAISSLDRSRSEAEACEGAQTAAKTHAEDLDRQLGDCNKAHDADKTKQDETDKLAADMAKNLDATRGELEELRQQHADADKRLAAFKSLAEKLRKMIDAGKLEVVIRRGRMIVKLPAEVLFASGSSQLSTDGQTPLKELAAVLRQFPDRHFMVAGHTDNIPIGPSNYKSNWELSTARAVTVTEFLVSMGVNPTRLAAAGYGEFDPIKGNGSDLGRRENRRIEIVLLPNIEELPPVPKGADSAGQRPLAKAKPPGK